MKNFNKKIIAFLFALSVSLTNLPLGIYAASQTQTKWTEDDFTWDRYDPSILTGLNPKYLDSDERVTNSTAYKEKLAKNGGKLIIPRRARVIDDMAFAKKGLEGEVIIPDSVTTIGNSAFQENNLTGVTIPNSVTEIRGWAFLCNNLTQVTIPDSVTKIEEYTFCRNHLTQFTIPESVTEIGNAAFDHNCLTQITIPDSVTEMGNGVFYRNSLTQVTISNSVKIIRSNTFGHNNLTQVTIPNSIKKIEQGAFADNSLTQITIPNSVTEIERQAFKNNKLTEIKLLNPNTSLNDNVFGYQSITYTPQTLPFDFNFIKINDKTVVVDKSENLDVVGNQFKLSDSSQNAKANVSNDKFQYSGTITINANPDLEPKKYNLSTINEHDKHDTKGTITISNKPTRIKITKVGKDDTTKQLEGAEFEIIEVEDEEKEDILILNGAISVDSGSSEGTHLTNSEIANIKGQLCQKINYSNEFHDIRDNIDGATIHGWNIDSNFIVKKYNGKYGIFVKITDPSTIKKWTIFVPVIERQQTPPPNNNSNSKDGKCTKENGCIINPNNKK